jgi:hypothetical protein
VPEEQREVHADRVAQETDFGIVPNPEVLRIYKSVSESLPVLVVQTIDEQLKREYRYALGGQVVAAIALILMAGGFVYLVMNGHDTPAYVLLGAGVLNTISGFLRARLADNRSTEPNRASRG